MTKLSIGQEMGAIAKSAIHPAAYVALGNLFLKSKLDPKGFGASAFETLGNLWQGLPFANGKKSFIRTITQLDLSSGAMRFFREHSFEMGTAAFWGVTSTLANRVLKETPGIRNYPKTRVFVAGMIGAGTTWATWQFGLNRCLDVQKCTDLALKVGIIGGVWKIATTSFKSLRFLDWGGLPEAPKQEPEVPSEPLPESPEPEVPTSAPESHKDIYRRIEAEIEDQFPCKMMDAILDQIDTEGLFRLSAAASEVEKLYSILTNATMDPTEAIADAARKDIMIVTNTLKQYFKMMNFHLLDKIKIILLGMDPEHLDVNDLRNETNKLAIKNKVLLKKLMKFLSKIAANSKNNSMPASNLAIVMAPNLFTFESVGEEAKYLEKTKAIVTFMIEHYSEIFESILRHEPAAKAGVAGLEDD